MNKEITMIELLNNLCNGMKIKGKFKTSDGTVFNDIESLLDQEGLIDCDYDLLMVIESLNDKVEILEEDKPIIEKIEIKKYNFHNDNHSKLLKNQEQLSNKLNELIDVVNELRNEVKHD